MRQLVAHETGHALGFAHNFAAHRHPVPSVMDYPAPDFGVEEPGIPCAREPYAEGPGPWDVAQIRLIYGNQAPGDVVKPELCYLTDADGRTPATASATAATWVVPAGPQAGLRQVLAVRASALRRFGPGVLPPGSRPHELQRRFAMIYLLHRHQVVYVVKQVSGTRRSGDPAAGYPEAMEFVPAEEQAAALRTLADLISPAFLRIEDQVLSQILPYGDESEPIPGGFSHRTAGTFDISEAVGAATDVVASPLLAPERLNRLAQQAGLGGVGLAPVLELTVDYAAGLADDPRDTVSEAIAWTLLARLERSLRSPGLHAEPRSAVMDRCDAAREDARRPALRRRLEKLIRAAEENERLPRVPLGVPI